jgi:hypothetical protein
MATSTPKNRVWSFENTPSGRPCADLDLSWENAMGSVQYTYQIASGRAEWLSRDPLGERVGPNLYQYVSNNPVYFVDPLGLDGQFSGMFTSSNNQGYSQISNYYQGTPPNSSNFTGPSGQNFSAPPGTDFNSVYQAGQNNGTAGIPDALGHFGSFDFQRNMGNGRCQDNTYYRNYAYASNYAVGVYMNGAGYSLSDTIAIASAFGQTMSSNAGAAAQTQGWTDGWNAAQSGNPNGGKH